MGQTLFINYLLPLSAPSLTAAEYAGVKWITVYDKYPFYVVSGFQIDDQPVLIQRITHLFRCFMIYCCKIHAVSSLLSSPAPHIP